MNILMLLTPKKDVKFLKTSDNLARALDPLREFRYSSVPLLDQDGHFVGTITEGDLLWHLEKKNNRHSLADKLSAVTRIRDYEPVGINASMDELIETSLGQNFIPILDDRNFFIGIVTRKDLITNFISQFQTKAEVIHDNPLLNALYKRRSIRKFQSGAINKEVLDEILKVSLVSPSAGNRRPQHVILLEKEEDIKKLSELHHRGGQFENAPYLLLVLNDENIESNSNNVFNNSGALIISLLLAIDSFENLGGFWVATRSVEHNHAILKFLNVPDNFSLSGIIAFGIKNEFKGANEAEDFARIHRDRWWNYVSPSKKMSILCTKAVKTCYNK